MVGNRGKALLLTMSSGGEATVGGHCMQSFLLAKRFPVRPWLRRIEKGVFPSACLVPKDPCLRPTALSP